MNGVRSIWDARAMTAEEAGRRLVMPAGGSLTRRCPLAQITSNAVARCALSDRAKAVATADAPRGATECAAARRVTACSPPEPAATPGATRHISARRGPVLSGQHFRGEERHLLGSRYEPATLIAKWTLAAPVAEQRVQRSHGEVAVAHKRRGS